MPGRSTIGQWRRPGAEFGGTDKFFSDLNDVFFGKNFTQRWTTTKMNAIPMLSPCAILMLSPYLFSLALEAVMSLSLKDTEAGIDLNVAQVNNLRFADNIGLLTRSRPEPQDIMTQIDEFSRKFGIIVNADKTKTMVIENTKETLNKCHHPASNQSINQSIFVSQVECTNDAIVICRCYKEKLSSNSNNLSTWDWEGY